MEGKSQVVMEVKRDMDKTTAIVGHFHTIYLSAKLIENINGKMTTEQNTAIHIHVERTVHMPTSGIKPFPNTDEILSNLTFFQATKQDSKIITRLDTCYYFTVIQLCQKPKHENEKVSLLTK